MQINNGSMRIPANRAKVVAGSSMQTRTHSISLAKPSSMPWMVMWTALKGRESPSLQIDKKLQMPERLARQRTSG